MRIAVSGAAALVALVGCTWRSLVLAGHAEDARSARTLTKDDFDSFLEAEREKQRACLVMFHVSWCKVCQKTFPKYAAASDQVAEKQINMDFAHVDCTDDKTLCQRFGVKGYPTIKLFQPKADADPLSFKSQRSEEGFVKYAERMTQPVVRDFATAAKLDEALRTETFSAFIAVAPSAKAAPSGFLTVAERWRDRHIFTVAPRLHDLLPEAIDVPSSATLAVLSAGRQQWPGADNTSEPSPAALFFDGDLNDAAAVGTWVEKHRFPGIWALADTNFYEFTHASRRTAMVAMDPARVSATQEKVLRGAAQRLREDFVFGVVDGVSWAEELSDFNIAKQDLPRVVVTEDDFEAWFEDVDELRLETLEADLRGLRTGSKMLLRQGRGALARMLFYKREAWRYSVQLHAYSQKGTKEAVLALAVVAGGLLSVMLLGWCAASCCSILLAEDPMDYPGPPQVGRVKRD